MRTITEFFGRNLTTAAEKLGGWNEGLKKDVAEKLKAEGKTDEEIASGLDAAVRTELEGKIAAEFKLDGEKATLFMAALSLIGGKKGQLKRVIVMAPGEGETAPAGTQEIDGKFYMVEMFSEQMRTQAPPREDKNAKGGRGGRGGRDDKRGGGKPGGPGRGPRRDDAAGGFAAPTGGTPGKITPKGAAPAPKSEG